MSTEIQTSQLESICLLEQQLLQLPQADMLTTHHFCNGLYARTLHIPAGTVLTGAIHKDECFFLVRFGILVVTTDDGAMRLGTGDMVVSKANSKRAGVALTDVICTTFHVNEDNETDHGKLWDNYMLPNPPEYAVEEHILKLRSA